MEKQGSRHAEVARVVLGSYHLALLWALQQGLIGVLLDGGRGARNEK
jgi:hypothetical protein